MPYSTVKALFLSITGRADLEDVGVADTPLVYINAGQRLLDELFDENKAIARNFSNLVINQVLVNIGDVRAIKEVWLYDAEKRTQLIREDAANLRKYYNFPVASETKDAPVYYAPINIRSYPSDISALSLNQAWALQDVKTSLSELYNGILLAPPVDVSSIYILEVLGMFYTPELTASPDAVSYWTEKHALILAWAAAYHLEISYRNTEGAKDWMTAILDKATRLDKDIVANEITDITSMERKIWNTPS